MISLVSPKCLQSAAIYTRKANFHSTHLVAVETVQVPTMAESITEGTLKSWVKKVGDTVAQDEEVATIETDKIDVSVNSPYSGTITELLANEEDTVSIGQDLFRIEPGDVSASSPPPSSESKPTKDLKDEQPKKEQPKKEEDLTPAPPQQQPKADKPPPPPKPDISKQDKASPAPAVSLPANRRETRVKMNRMRVTIANRLKQSQDTAASLTTFNEIDMSALMAFRKKYKDEILKSHDVKLGFMSAFAKASTLALKEIPAANAYIEGEEIVYHDFVDLSVAVATPKGLVTPVVRNVESMGFIDIEKEIAALGKKARDGKLALEDMSGGTFTISNGGVFGSLYGTPIINLPQSAVLGMHAIKEKPVVVNGEIVIRPIMVVALTYDHRLLDGREAVTFLVKVKDYLEDPLKMLLP